MLIRQNARHPHEARELVLVTDVFPRADGFCEVTLGDTKVMCTAYVQEEKPGLTIVFNESGRMKWQRIHGHKDHQTENPKSVEEWVKQALEPTIISVTNQDMGLLVILDALVDDGSLEAACTTGANVALMAALNQRSYKTEGSMHGIQMRHQVVAVTCGTFGGDIAVDLDKGEMRTAEVWAQFAITSNMHIASVKLFTRTQECGVNHMVNMAAVAMEKAKEYFRIMDEVVGHESRDKKPHHRKATRLIG